MMEIILKDFDIRRMGERCNFKTCKNRPNREIFIYQYTLTRKKGIATLFLCDKHLNLIEPLIKKLKEKNPSMIIKNDVINMGR